MCATVQEGRQLQFVSRRLGYQPALDGLRGLAVLAVMLFHLGYSLGGNSGVTVFFTLSGFLITCLLLEEYETTGDVSFGRFYMRRALRLFPALAAVLLIDVGFVLLARTGWSRNADLAAAGAAVFYVSNWVEAWHVVPLNQLGHTWSLAVEEQFYLVWPWVILTLARRQWSSSSLVAILLGGGLALTLERFGLATLGVSANRLYVGSDTRADALLYGAAAAVTFRAQLMPKVFWMPGVLAVGFLALLAHLGLGWAAVEKSTAWAALATPTMVAMFTAALLLGLTTGSTRISGLAWGPLRYLGQISYGLYLWHYLLFTLITTANLGLPRWADLVLRLGLTLTVAAASYRYLEQPFLRLKGRFAGQASPAVMHQMVTAGTLQ
jgi:peptidoglycan/LPS O-acetylase OafA/YrhL